MDAPIIYTVIVWVSPDGGDRYLRWLEDKHMREVIAEPGFLWARRVQLEQTDAHGWQGYLLLYGLIDRAALEAYLHSPSRERFWRELEPFNSVYKGERVWGKVDFALTNPPARHG